MFLVYHYYRRGVLLIYVCKRVFIKNSITVVSVSIPKANPVHCKEKNLAKDPAANFVGGKQNAEVP